MPQYLVRFIEKESDPTEEHNKVNHIEDTIETENEMEAGRIAIEKRRDCKEIEHDNLFRLLLQYEISSIKEVTGSGPEIYDESGFRIG